MNHSRCLGDYVDDSLLITFIAQNSSFHEIPPENTDDRMCNKKNIKIIWMDEIGWSSERTRGENKSTK